MLTTLILFAALTIPAADEPKKTGDVALVNKAKDIHVVGDRDEPIADYFRRNHLVVGTVLDDGLKKLADANKPLDSFFISYASYNDDRAKGALFGANLKLAPPSKAVAKLIDEQKAANKISLTLILKRDDKEAGLYHVVGCTKRTPVGFFDDDKKNEADGICQKELRFVEPKK